MIVSIVLTGVVTSLAFALAAYLAERGLHALGLPTRVPWIAALLAPAAVPAGQLLAHMFEAPPALASASSAQVLPLTTILTAGVVERLSAATVTNLESWLAGLWVCASLVIGVRLAYSSRTLARAANMWKRGQVAGVDAWISETYGPAVIGLRHPEIVVPQRTADLPLEEQRLAVAHELEHIAKKDQWLACAAALVVAAVPWNPVAWLAARRLRSAIEIDCDARVLHKKPNVSAYVSLVINVASWPRESPTRALAMGEGAVTQLERRLRIMTTQPRSQRVTPAIVCLSAAFAVAVYGCEIAVNSGVPDTAARVAQDEVLRQQLTLVPILRAGQDTRVPPNEVHKLPKVVTTGVTTKVPGSHRAYFEFQVDKPVAMAPGSAAPRYPQILREAGVEGEVLVQFVVDQQGRADPSTFKVLKSSHDLFAESVERALPGMRFAPAELGGKRVKQLVEQPFAFMIAK